MQVLKQLDMEVGLEARIGMDNRQEIILQISETEKYLKTVRMYM